MKLIAIFLALMVNAVFAQRPAISNPSLPTQVSLGARLALSKLADDHLTEDEGEALSKMPGVAPHLVQILTNILDKPGDFEHLHKVFQVLRGVKTIPDDQMAVIRERMTAFLGEPVESGLPYILRLQGIYLLAEHPSPENEALIIRFLNEPPPPNGTDYSFIAADALGMSGGLTAQAALEAYQRTHPQRPDVADKCADYAAKSIERIRVRLSATNPNQTSSTQNPPPSLQPQSPKKTPGAMPVAASEEPTSQTPWSIIIILIVAAIGLLWLLVKNRK